MNSWIISYEKYAPAKEGLRETLCTLGNGFFATRGAGAEATDDGTHYPGTYLAGGYNRLTSEVSGKDIENEDLVNWPDWTVLSFRPEGGEWFSPDAFTLIRYRQDLDLKKGELRREMVVEDSEGRKTEVQTARIVHMGHPHLAAIHWKITPLNWGGKIEVRSGINGAVINNGVPRYRELESRHLEPLDSGTTDDNDLIWHKTKTNQSEIEMAIAARTLLTQGGTDLRCSTRAEKDHAWQYLRFTAEEGKVCMVEKVVAIYTSKDYAITNPLTDACRAATEANGYSSLLVDHARAWEGLWHRCDIVIQGNDHYQRLLRLHIFHLLQTASPHTTAMDVGIPPRGWHGEAYRGHIQWDELFIFPFLNYTLPEITRELLMYRYRRLGMARKAAEKAGYEGAMFPWQSGSNGREESQVIHLNPESGNWIPDNTYLQRHVNLGVAYNILQYYCITNDSDFMAFYGMEMLLSICRFLSSLAHYNEERKKFEIHKVVGPDEYHTGYPDSDEPGLKNNTYTNVMTAWVLKSTLGVLPALDQFRLEEIRKKIHVSDEDMQRWKDIATEMYIPFAEEGVMSQFEGYEDLEELDWEKYHSEHGEILRLDRILEKEGESPNRYKASKQADVLMLFYLLPLGELQSLMKDMGYTFGKEELEKNIRYYDDRTSHGSTLSKLVHSWVMARLDRTKSWQNFYKALVSDFEDIQGGTTPEGIHLGAMAGTVDIVQRCYPGLQVQEEVLSFNPKLPEEVGCISYRLKFRRHWLFVEITENTLRVKSESQHPVRPVRLRIKGQEAEIKAGHERVFSLNEEEKAPVPTEEKGA